MFTSPHVGQPGGLNARREKVFGSSLRTQPSVEMITCNDSASAVDSTQQGTKLQPHESESRSQHLSAAARLALNKNHSVQICI